MVIMLPEKFKERMERMLGDEYPAFIEALDESAVRGVRANRLKISAEELTSKSSLVLEKLAYAEDGFILRDTDVSVGACPEHHAGMIYMQDPGAMATVNAVRLPRGAWVLDSCSAPGGKTTQLAAMVGHEGFVFANEYVPKRAKIVVSNLERLGVRSAIVTSMDTARFPEMFRAAFDLVLCDAPCSGEGMFRKSDDALEMWSEENVAMCAERQKEILDNCAPVVKSGGYLLYSTCTYSQEENEDVVRAFLMRHSDFTLVPVCEELISVTRDGIGEDMRLARRFYPHVSEGEGQFLALMKRDENIDISSSILYKSCEKTLTKQEYAIVDKFFADCFNTRPLGRLVKHGSSVVLIPHECPIPEHSVFMSGVTVGEIKGTLLFPHHQLFSAYGCDMKRRERLTAGDERVEKYLRGEEIDTHEVTDGGWCAVLYEGAALGGGKASGGRIKNHYPKGLRNK